MEMKEETNKCKKRVGLYTLGCKVNQYETNAIAQEFEKAGYKIVHNSEKADVYIINTCTVTNIADKKSRQVIRRFKQINPNSIVVACGCYVQVGKQELENIKEIDLILGNTEKNKILLNIENYVKSKENIKLVEDIMKKKEFLEFGIITYTEKSRAVIKIQDGCDRFCSYCIIPYARGPVRSRNLENIITEIESVVEKGIKEVVITGIHVASYGKDLNKKIGLIDLLEKINKIEGLKRIRLSSIEPTIVKEEFVKRLSKLEKICDHFHLSLQSGCDEVLKRMNRKYTTEEFRISTNILRKYFPKANLTTDIIVGFPGETEEEFKTTYEFLENINFYKMHIFKYSPRKGTKAAQMENQIDGNIKEQRSKKLIKLSDKCEQNQNSKYIGEKLEVLFEEVTGEFIQGHTTNYVLVRAPKDKFKENQIGIVEIIKLEKNSLIAK